MDSLAVELHDIYAAPERNSGEIELGVQGQHQRQVAVRHRDDRARDRPHRRSPVDGPDGAHVLVCGAREVPAGVLLNPDAPLGTVVPADPSGD